MLPTRSSITLDRAASDRLPSPPWIRFWPPRTVAFKLGNLKGSDEAMIQLHTLCFNRQGKVRRALFGGGGGWHAHRRGCLVWAWPCVQHRRHLLPASPTQQWLQPVLSLAAPRAQEEPHGLLGTGV